MCYSPAGLPPAKKRRKGTNVESIALLDSMEVDSKDDSFDNCMDSICKSMAALAFDVISDDFLCSFLKLKL